MSEREEDAKAAAEIMLSWQWKHCDPDGFPFDPGMSLDAVINRLAMAGIKRPRYVLLDLLCEGKLVARGNCYWRKYEHGERYEVDCPREIIPVTRWQTLSATIAEEARTLFTDDWLEPTITLERLDFGEQDRHQWEPRECRFSTAARTENVDGWTTDYFEEIFWAQSIEVWPKEIEELDETQEPALAPPTKSVGRPPANWWAGFAEELAVFIHEEGLPPGTGHEGQEDILKRIQSRLATAGKAEAARSSVQPVINAVLDRIRSAGN